MLFEQVERLESEAKARGRDLEGARETIAALRTELNETRLNFGLQLDELNEKYVKQGEILRRSQVRLCSALPCPLRLSVSYLK